MIHWYLLFLFPFICAFSKTKIYDCFPFFNELEILEVRLDELYDHVDYFVLVESTQTFRGNSKPLHYHQNQERFKKYKDKIIHVLLNEPMHGDGKHWDREVFQRNQIMRGLKKCSKNDLILISDVDEIVRGSDVKKLIDPVRSGKHKIVSGQLRSYTLYMNRQGKDLFCKGSVATTYGYLKKKSPEKVRAMRNSAPLLPDIGWHFSSVGGLDRYIYKVKNYCHFDEYPEDKQDPNFIYNHIQANFSLVSIDETYPQFIRDHQMEFRRIGFLDYEGNPAYQ